MMMEISVPAREIGEESASLSPGTGADKARPPTDLVYSYGQIGLEPPHARAEEERRRFVEGLRRLRGREVDVSEKRG